jgi:CDGSH-type Zn-finger protein
MTSNDGPPVTERGRLAQVIATRGGLAPPEAPFVIEHREALIYMLCEAAELEHGIMCQYLFAAFTIKQNEDEGLTAAELAAARRWRKVIAHVATQEMLHLALVENLLSAVGAAPHLSRPNFPHPASHYPAGVHLALLPFGAGALRHFMFLERPEGMDLHDADGLAAFGRAVPHMLTSDIVPRGQDFATVGHMYRSIEAGFRHLCEKYGERWLFVGPPRAQATQEYFGWPELVPVTDLASAQRAIDEILEQGEGPRGHWEDAHFGKFVEILDEFEQAREANRGLIPARPVLPVNVRPCERDVEVPLVSDPVTAKVMDLFNVAYEILLQILERFFAHTDETDTQLKALADATMGLMLRVIKPLGDLITTLPAGPGYPGVNAGPSFELFYESDYLLPHRDAAWALLTERLDVAAAFCQEIVTGQPSSGEPSSGEPSSGQSSSGQSSSGQSSSGQSAELGPAGLAASLTPVGAALAGTAQALAAYLPAGDPRSRPAAAAGATAAAVLGATEVAALLARVDGLGQTRQAAVLPDGLAEDIAEVFDSTQVIIMRVLRPGAGLAHPGAGDAALAWTAPRLINSVLRPLADFLRRPVSGSPTAPEAPVTPDASDAPDTSGGTPSDRPADSGTSAVSDLLWQLSLHATRLRVRRHEAGGAPPELAEAVAALQDVACALAPAADAAAARAAQLRELQASLPAGIQTAPNGPYLVTNGPDIRTPLGLPLQLPPQVALCRCGGSARKPFCDGSHAANGFSDAKDPKRVPDQRDTYDGEQVTIFDNRGICQHSGLCTDRLGAVFRANAEPFVAPSGGRMDEIVRAVRDCPSGALSLAFDGPGGPEERDLADWHSRRESAIEITQDGPYRVSGGIGLSGPASEDVSRAEGSSREHYALCRCGHSQNKPFCSGMHWYIGFTDPQPSGREPSLFEWAGGLPALTRMTRLLYEKHVPADALLAPLSADVLPGHPQREAARIGAAFGGPPPGPPGPPGPASPAGPAGPAATAGDGHEFTADQCARWITLAGLAADEAGLPADPQFRAALGAFFGWDASRALARAVASGRAGEQSGPPSAAVPRWDWTAAGAPGPDGTNSPASPEPQPPVTLPGPDEPVSFAAHIKPMFRLKDRQSMLFAFDLWSYDDVRGQAAGILERLSDGTMPCDGAWPSPQIELFRRWTESGLPA